MRAYVAGAGLAGCECAWQLAKRGAEVTLLEMKPLSRISAHHTDFFAELCCSNSLRGEGVECAPGLLKEEMRRLESLIIRCADETRVPAGGALAVDRDGFSKAVTAAIRANPRITVIARELESLPGERPLIVATGPLTTDALARDILRVLGGEDAKALSFFDASAPLVAAESIDMQSAYFASRYGKGGGDYLNCPMDKDEYTAFWKELCGAERAQLHAFEDEAVFEGCLPVEVMAGRGPDTLRYGPLKPIGIRDPRTDKGAYAVVQLRRDNAAGSVYNLVGFQTHLTFPEQRRVFSMIPALRNAEFLRFGVMHRNSFIDSPRLLTADFQSRVSPGLYFAGQLTGVEGYIESAASGLVAGICAYSFLSGEKTPVFPPETAVGALCRYISDPGVKEFQPMNINFGLLPPLPGGTVKKGEKKGLLARRALETLGAVIPCLPKGRSSQ
ncbi:MAG: methylenetetrahydrofolate--tRNA-(uracil(54)-C(5))-methyltransferase (FADH(2)-oxidizing) TrmFO [Oscillospiraceae bacterium]|nr:methylenetetrahydrofolate--tRNA-(uracil(54)-C(5))-methyltransferase (FADH(2)-oxidizing) TrmFO [Oscillospiraceae bacterium]